MSNGHGGARAGAGKKPTESAISFRQWCREAWADDGVRETVLATMRESAEFALRVAEHGFGRPPQSLAITGSLDLGADTRHVVVLPGGFALPAAATGVPTTDADQHGAN